MITKQDIKCSIVDGLSAAPGIDTISMLLGMWNLYQATGDSVYQAQVRQAVNGQINTGFAENADLTVFGYGRLLFALYEEADGKDYRTALDKLRHLWLEKDRTSEGVIWNKTQEPSPWWLDGLYLAEPFYLQYENCFHEKLNYNDIQNQFKQIKAQVADRMETIDSKHLGWYLMGLADSCELLSEEAFDHYKNIERMCKDLLCRLLGADMQQEIPMEITYTILKGCRLGFLQEEKYIPIAIGLLRGLQGIPKGNPGPALLAFAEYFRRSAVDEAWGETRQEEVIEESDTAWKAGGEGESNENRPLLFNPIFMTSRRVTIELIQEGIYYADHPYEIWLDGVFLMGGKKVVQTIDGLKPDTAYEIQIRMKGRESSAVTIRTDYEYVTLNVKKFGAKGDGIQDDTIFIQAAINACPRNSRVYIPGGIYRVASLFLKSDLTLDLDSKAVLSGFVEREKFPILPGLIESYDEESEYNLGSWEGNPLDTFASMITGINVSKVVITGGGTLEGNASFENWWEGQGREKKGGAFRPRMIFLNHCEDVTIQGITVQNSPSWNLHPYFSNRTRWIDLKVLNPKLSPNTDGMDPESVDGLEVVGVYFSLGDDCIAMKSGKFYMGNKYKTASQNIEIRQCYMCHGHGSVTLGSEMAAGVKHLVCRDCLFEDTDRGLRVKTRRGRGEDAVIEDITFEHIKMEGVLTPFVVNSFYWCCDPDGKSEYVSCKDALPVDERTPQIRQLTFRDIEAHNCHVAASFIYGLPESKIEEVSFENIRIDFAEHPIPEYPAMMAEVEPCTNKGIYINNAKKVVLKNVKVEGTEGEPIEIHHVDEVIQN